MSRDLSLGHFRRTGEGAGAEAPPGTHSLGRFLEHTPATSHAYVLLREQPKGRTGTEMDTIPSLPAGDTDGGSTAGSRAGGMLRARPHAVGTRTVAAARGSTCPGLQLEAMAAPLTLGQGGSRRASTALSPGDSRDAGFPPALGCGLAGQHRGSIAASSCPALGPHQCPAHSPASLVQVFSPLSHLEGTLILRSSTQCWGSRSSHAASRQPQLVRYRRACLFLLFNVCAFSS